jgi:hydrogenase large subunit
MSENLANHALGLALDQLDQLDHEISPELLAHIARAHSSVETGNDDPFRRIGGTLEIYCSVDLERRRVSDAASVATMFRGYEALLARRDLKDAGLVSSTAAGICGGVHATASSQCLEMALGIVPPPLGIVVRNLLLSCQYLNDNPMHLFVLSGPDYSAETFAATNPEILAKAERTPAPHADTHGHSTIAALMRALDRGTGALYTEALRMVGRARQAHAILVGKASHSESIIPGGVNVDLSPNCLHARGTGLDSMAKLDEFVAKLEPFIDYAERVACIWDDIFDFLVEANPDYARVGEAPATMVDFGQWDNEDHYDASYARCDEWGRQRWSTPGAVIEGRLVTTRLTELNCGLEDSVERSFYDFAGHHPYPADPLGNPLGPRHPWNRWVTPNPEPGRSGRSGPPYSWASALTWRGHPFEVGAYARLYISALARSLPASPLLESTGDALLLRLPSRPELSSRPGNRADVPLCWRIPARWNAFERNRARAYAIAYNLLVTLEHVGRAKALLQSGNTQLSTAFEVPREGQSFGAGFCGAGRGFLAHWAVIEAGRFTNYQIAVPSRINAGPRAPTGALGSIERALTNTPILESWSDASELQGIDVIRCIQSFDPCMTCSAHIRIENTDALLERVVTTSGP